jgi:hypothetical protein
MNKQIIITVTKIKGNAVSHDLPWASGCHISNFPHTPKIGEKFVLTYDDKNPYRIIKIDTVSSQS